MKNFWMMMLFCVALNVAVAQDGVQFIEDKTWEEVLTLAQEENKIIFLDAYTTWCGPCKKMSRDVFPLSSVGNLYNEKFISIKMDMEKGDGANVAKRYNIRAFPTLMFVDGSGEVVHRVAGYQSEKRMLQLADDVANPLRQLAAMKAQYNKGKRDADFLYAYAYASKDAMENRSYYKVAKEYLATQEDWASKQNMKFILDFVSRTDMEMFNYLIKNRSEFNQAFGPREVTAKVEKLISVRIDQLLSLKNGEDQKTFLEANKLFKKVSPAKAEGLTASFKMTYYRNGGDRQNFAKAAVEYVELMPTLSAAELSDIAWTFYRVIEDEAQLEKALDWAKKALKMEKDVAHYDTVASLYQKLGNKRKAKRYAKKGIKYAKSTNETYDNLQELIDAL